MSARIKITFLFAAIICSNTIIAQNDGIKVLGDTCNNFTPGLQATGTNGSPYFFWNFGDHSSGTNDTITITGGSALTNATHTFSAPGTYNVCASY